MSQLAVYIHSSGPGSGTVTSVSGGVGINITGVPTVNPTVNLDVPVTIAHGGTNAITFANTEGVIYFDGTRLVTTNTGTNGQILTISGGIPVFAANTGGVITLDGDVGSATGDPILITGGTSGAIFTGSGTTLTESFNFLALPNSAAGGTAGYISFGGTPFVQNYGTLNTFVGPSAGNFTLAGAAGNVGVGYLALSSLTTGGENVGIGTGALLTLDSGVNNVAIGAGAMQTGDDASNSVAIGYFALHAMDAADNNVAVGANALEDNIDSPSNIAIGKSAINTLTTGSGLNIGIGNNVLDILDSGQSNIAIGNDAGANYNTTESSNIVIGNEGVNADNNTIRIGTQGNGVGQQDVCFIAGITGVTVSNASSVVINTVTGQLGVAAGGGSPVETITGNSGGALTPTAGNINIVTANSTVTFAGSGSTETLDFNLSNIVFGSALPLLAGGVSNVAVGSLALSSLTSGQGNAVLGFHSGIALSSGSDNTLIGVDVASSLLTGSNNTIIGENSGDNYVGAESNNILIQNIGTAAESNVIRIGTAGSGVGQQNACFIAGITGVNVGSVATVATIASTGQLGGATITAGTNVSVTPGANTITIAANTASIVTNYTGIVVGASPYTALSTDYYIAADVTGGAITVRLPTAPSTGRTFVVKDKVGLAATNNITVTSVSGAVNIDGATTFVMNTAYEAASFIFNGTSYEVF